MADESSQSVLKVDLRSEVVAWKLAVAVVALVALVALVDQTTPPSVLFLYGVIAVALVATAIRRIGNRHVLFAIGGFAAVFGLYVLATEQATPVVAAGYLVAGSVAAALGYRYPFGDANATA